ncbi:MAG: DUF4116 domain-containing protein [bacterium]
MDALDKYIKSQNITRKEFFEKNPKYLYYNNDIKDMEYLLRNFRYYLKYIRKEYKYKAYLEFIKRNPLDLSGIKEQTPELCMIAVKQDGRALKYVKSQTPEICMEAVKQDGRLLEYVKSQTPEICMAAVKQTGIALIYTSNDVILDIFNKYMSIISKK